MLYQVIGGWSIKYMVDYIGGIGVASGANNVGDMFGTFTTSVGMPVVYLLVFALVVGIIVLFGVNKGIEKVHTIFHITAVCNINTHTQRHTKKDLSKCRKHG